VSTEFEQLADQLIEAGHFLHGKGWVPATSGNFSARLADGRLALTVSGRHKGRLTRDDILLADADGKSLDARKPSDETALHVQLYKRFPDAGCVLHPHSLNATLLSKLSPEGLEISDYELLKAFPDINTLQTSTWVPVFPNDQDIPRLAVRVDHYMQRHPNIHGYLIEGHGFYTWGRSVADSLRHVEAFEFLFECEMTLRRLKA